MASAEPKLTEKLTKPMLAERLAGPKLSEEVEALDWRKPLENVCELFKKCKFTLSFAIQRRKKRKNHWKCVILQLI